MTKRGVCTPLHLLYLLRSVTTGIDRVPYIPQDRKDHPLIWGMNKYDSNSNSIFNCPTNAEWGTILELCAFLNISTGVSRHYTSGFPLRPVQPNCFTRNLASFLWQGGNVEKIWKEREAGSNLTDISGNENRRKKRNGQSRLMGFWCFDSVWRTGWFDIAEMHDLWPPCISYSFPDSLQRLTRLIHVNTSL